MEKAIQRAQNRGFAAFLYLRRTSFFPGMVQILVKKKTRG
jgi:hypothetical protein